MTAPIEYLVLSNKFIIRPARSRIGTVITGRGVAASRFLGRQELVAYKVLVLTLGSMITIPMVWSM